MADITPTERSCIVTLS